MPWSTSYSGNSADCRFTGATDGEQVRTAITDTLVHRYDGHLKHVIIDFSLAQSMDLPTADLLRVAESDRLYLLLNPAYAMVMIAPQGIVFGHARTFQRFMEGSSLRSAVVQTRKEAVEWLRQQED